MMTCKSKGFKSHQKRPGNSSPTELEHTVFCQSPSSDAFRMKSRRFPAHINCMIIYCFHTWPDNALYHVAKQLLSDAELAGNGQETVVQFIANAYSKIIQFLDEYLEGKI